MPARGISGTGWLRHGLKASSPVERLIICSPRGGAQAIDALKVAYVQGRLTKDEFDERLGRALAPLTHAELAALTGDLPDELATAGRPRGADQDMTRLQEGNRAEARVLATLVAGVMLVALIGNGIGSPLHVLAIVLLLSPVWMLALGGVLLLHSARPSRPDQTPAQADARPASARLRLAPRPALAGRGPRPSPGCVNRFPLAVPAPRQACSSGGCHTAPRGSA